MLCQVRSRFLRIPNSNGNLYYRTVACAHLKTASNEFGGEGKDAVVVVYPYYTPQIGQTVLAGHSHATLTHLVLSADVPTLSQNSKALRSAAVVGVMRDRM